MRGAAVGRDCDWRWRGVVPAGECRCLIGSQHHAFVFRPQKELAMDEEGGPKPAGPPTRKKFLIPMDEDVVPPPGVGLGDEGTSERLGGVG